MTTNNRDKYRELDPYWIAFWLAATMLCLILWAALLWGGSELAIWIVKQIASS